MPPSLFPLNSEQLSNLSAALKSSATNLAHNAVEAAERWQYIYGLGLAGESFNAAYEQEDMTHRASRQTAAQLAELARTMDKAAAKQKVLDGLAQYALPFLEAEGEINIPVSIFMTQLGTLARALDLATAFAASMIGGDDTKVRGLTLADFGDMSAAEINEINSHRLTPEAAAALEEFTKDRKPGDPPVHVLEVEPGKMVVAVGDIDTADSITTLVAGVGSSNPAGWATYLHRTDLIQQHTHGAAIMWLGYDAPSSVPAAVSPRAAREGAPSFQEIQSTLRRRDEVRNGASKSGHRQRLLVAAHSFGSLLAFTAAASPGGLEADGLLAMGSPGAAVLHKSQLNLHATDGDPEVYAVTGSRDWISMLGSAFGGYHGADPSDALFGAERWPSESDHDYWKDESFLKRVGEAANAR